MLQLLSGVGFLHGMGIIHRDVKLPNQLVRQDFPWWTALGDLGSAKRLAKGRLLTDEVTRSMVGTRQYIAPEVVLDPLGYGSEADSYSCGVVLFAMLQGDPSVPIYQFAHVPDTLKEFVEHRVIQWDNIHHRQLQLTSEGQQVLELLRGLLHEDPRRRWTVNFALQSKWIRKAPIIGPQDLHSKPTRPGTPPPVVTGASPALPATRDHEVPRPMEVRPVRPRPRNVNRPPNNAPAPEGYQPVPSARPLLPESAMRNSPGVISGVVDELARLHLENVKPDAEPASQALTVNAQQALAVNVHPPRLRPDARQDIKRDQAPLAPRRSRRLKGEVAPEANEKGDGKALARVAKRQGGRSKGKSIGKSEVE
ncbi:unnamed protein product [Peniophora sp. CBMAI 1063]|nr:unnamed protein product [Peniophora sp. CBMAI 1063]